MKDRFLKIYIFAKEHLLFISVIVLSVFFLFLLVNFMISMYSQVVFNFPNKDTENISAYYSALSQLYGGIIGGIVGGLFTALGVGITICLTNRDRKEDLIKADKPRLLSGENIDGKGSCRISPKLNTLNEMGNRQLYFANELSVFDNKKHIVNFQPFCIYVTNNSDCILEGIVLSDKMIYDFENPCVLIRGNTYILDLSNCFFVTDESYYDCITLICTSVEERRYYFYCDCGCDMITKIEKNHKVVKAYVKSLEEKGYIYNKLIDNLEKNFDYKTDKYISELLKNKNNN